jgi:MraZ protein
VDSKGRVQLPIAQATALGNDVYVCRGHGTFLEIYGLLAWQRYLAKLVAAAERGPRRYRVLLRHVLGSAVAAKVDPQSRLVIPREILDWAKLSIASDDDSREVMVVGVGECVEVWNPDLYDKEMDEARPALGDIWDAARQEYVAAGIAETDLDIPAEDDESE